MKTEKIDIRGWQLFTILDNHTIKQVKEYVKKKNSNDKHYEYIAIVSEDCFTVYLRSNKPAIYQKLSI